MVNLYITRHGQTEWNVQHRMQGWLDSSLTSKGKRDAIALGENLQNVPFVAVYSSPSGRTIETTELIIGHRKLPLFLKPSLREINVGEWQGLTSTEIEKKYPQQYKAYYEDPLNYQSVAGENFSQVLARLLPTIHEIIERYDNDANILLITHGVVKKILINYFKGNDLSTVWQPPFIQGTSLTILHIDKYSKATTFNTIGDTAHIID